MILPEGDDYVGRAVNLASRLCDIAEPGQLLAATDDLELPEWVAATEHDPVMVKGMADEVRKSRTRSANALLAVVDGLTRPMRTWSQAS